MSSYFNQIIDKHLSFTDFSLISEASDINDLSFDGKDSPKNLLNKQVRFNSDININSFLNASVISDASLLESESKYVLSAVNPLPKLNTLNNNLENNYNIAFGRNYELHSHQKSTLSHIDNNDKTATDELTIVDSRSKQAIKEDDHNDNTSIWSSETELSVDSTVNHSSPSNKKDSFFKTIDGLSSGLSNNSSSGVETIISDEISENDINCLTNGNPYQTNNLSKPIVNSSKRLQEKINDLEADLHYRQTNVTQSAKELASKKLADQLNFKEKFNNNSNTFTFQTPNELTQPLNVNPDEDLFPDLTRLSVHDETILISQQRKLAAIRKRVGVDKIKRKIEDGLPEPDIMEFFDPNKHIFKSVNLSIGYNLINLKPKLSLSNGRLYSIFRDRDLLNQFQ